MSVKTIQHVDLGIHPKTRNKDRQRLSKAINKLVVYPLFRFSSDKTTDIRSSIDPFRIVLSEVGIRLI